MHKKMDENFLNVLYIEHTDKIGVLKDDKDERVSNYPWDGQNACRTQKRWQNVPSCTIDKEPYFQVQWR